MACGAIGQPCCASSSCSSTATCTNNVCGCRPGYYGPNCSYYFKGLAFGSSTHTEGAVNGISGDGTVAVGWSKGPLTGQFAVRWVSETGSTLPRLSDGSDAMATAVSANGNVIVGDSIVGSSPTAVVAFQFAANTMSALQLLQYATYSHATAVSQDGSVIVGWGDEDSEFQGLRWTNGTVGRVGSIDPITPLAMSANGQVLLGQQGSVSPYGALGTVRYASIISGSPMRFTSDFAPLDGEGVATATNSTGSIAAGYGRSGRALRWNSTTSQDLGDGAAYAMNGDGSIVVGTSANGAMIWDATNGMRQLSTVLTQAGVSLSGWTLREATGISSNGKVIVGNGDHGSNQEPWIVRLP